MAKLLLPTMNRSFRFLAILALALMPATAFANAGTPLMWATLLHLTIGNAFIGIGEGLLLAWVFKARAGQAVLVMIAANYASAWVGGLAIGELPRPDLTLVNLRSWMVIYVAATFVLTLVIEFPFVWFLLWKSAHAVRRAVLAVVVIHLVSYPLLVGWYWSASEASLLTSVEMVPAEQLLPKTPYVLYYLSPDGRRVLQTDLTGRNPVTLREVSATNWGDRLFVRSETDGEYSLFLLHDYERPRESEEELILADFSARAPVDWRIVRKSSSGPVGTGMNFGEVPSIASASDLEYDAGIYPVEGLSGWDKKTRLMKSQFALELPTAYWTIRNATQLQGDSVVFQLGKDQICLLEPSTRRIAIIARGKGPVVAEPRR
jgi:hypothetical protein